MRTAVVLRLIMPIAASSAMIAAMVSARRVAGHGDHVEADGADAGHRFELVEGERAGGRGVDHAASSDTGMNAPERPPT